MNRISLKNIDQIAFKSKTFVLDSSLKNQLSGSFSFLSEFSKDKIIYGINTGFGPMVQYKVEDDKLEQLQYNLIRSHSCGIGKPLDKTNARSVVLARLNSFLQGSSAVSGGVVDTLVELLNKDVTPEIFEHGGVGASGDLVQLAHLGLNLIGEGHVYVDGVRRPTAEVFKEKGIAPLKLKLRDGLGIINGTSCMTGISAVNLVYANRLLDLSVLASGILNEINNAYDDSFSVQLNAAKQHVGQRKVAEMMRNHLGDSKLIRKREELFSDVLEFNRPQFKNKIQSYYSLRCIPQILGPVYDTLQSAQQVVENELNSVSDNPIIDTEAGNVFHGGNFHGDYISLEMDKVKLVVTKMVMLMERQLNYMMNSKLNEKFPPFLNAGKLGFEFGFQGMQFTATSTTAECQTLSTSMYIHSISNNNDNQDIVSMGTNSAVLARKVIDNGYQVAAIHLMALCHAIDLLEEEEQEKLSSNTKKFHSIIREKLSVFNENDDLNMKMNQMIDLIKESELL